jgi:hypothetical protein
MQPKAVARLAAGMIILPKFLFISAMLYGKCAAYATWQYAQAVLSITRGSYSLKWVLEALGACFSDLLFPPSIRHHSAICYEKLVVSPVCF